MKTQELATVLALALGSPILCRDGHAGHLRKVVADPDSKRIRALIVDCGLTHYRVVVPIADVERVDDAHIQLRIDAHELAALPPYAEIDYDEPDPQWASRHGFSTSDAPVDLHHQVPMWLPPTAHAGSMLVRRHIHSGVPDQQATIGRGSKVVCPTGQVGHVAQVLFDPASSAICGLVVRLGHLHTRMVRVPAEWVGSVVEDEIHVSVDRSVVERLPDHQPAAA